MIPRAKCMAVIVMSTDNANTQTLDIAASCLRIITTLHSSI